ncbi:MAG: methylthioribulose 1-phosphate dehydratase [Myxococcota bacterium]
MSARHRASIITDAREFASRGWLLGTCGNLSARTSPDQFIVTASGRDKGRLTPDDFILCDLDAQPLGEPVPGLKPSAETLLHAAIYRRFPDVGAVYHVHDVHAALCSHRDEALGHTALADVEMIKGLGVWDEGAAIQIPILANPAHIPELAMLVEAFLAQRGDSASVPAVNILRHGTYAWGADCFAAKRHTDSLGYLFEYAWKVGAR